MKFVPFNRTHIDSFLFSAKAEGWISEQREIEFLLKNYPQGCLVYLFEGKPVAFITAIRYARSAWIGNLLVHPEYRQRGIARALIQKVLDSLAAFGCETVWLTASSDGAHLYRTLGFKEIDGVQRWKASGVILSDGDEPVFNGELSTIDSKGWGDNRAAIFAEIPPDSGCFKNDSGFLIYSNIVDAQQVGPWGASSRASAAQLMGRAVVSGDHGCNILLDVPVKNLFAGELLASRGFSVSGSTLLMYLGRIPEYRAEFIYSLASMGSYG